MLGFRQSSAYFLVLLGTSPGSHGSWWKEHCFWISSWGLWEAIKKDSDSKDPQNSYSQCLKIAQKFNWWVFALFGVLLGSLLGPLGDWWKEHIFWISLGGPCEAVERKIYTLEIFKTYKESTSNGLESSILGFLLFLISILSSKPDKQDATVKVPEGSGYLPKTPDQQKRFVNIQFSRFFNL